MLPSNRIYSAALDGQATPQLTVEVLDATGSNKNMCCISVGICTAHNIWGVLKHFRNHKCGRLFNHWISFDFGSATDTWIPCMTCLASPEFFPPWGRCRSNGLPWRTSHGGCGTSPQHVFGIERNLGNAKSEWIPNLITIFLDWKLRPASEKTDLLKRWPIAFFHVSTISRCLEHSGSAWPGVTFQPLEPRHVPAPLNLLHALQHLRREKRLASCLHIFLGLSGSSHSPQIVDVSPIYEYSKLFSYI